MLTGVFDPPPDHAAVPWAYLGGVLALTLGAVWAAGSATLRRLRRPAIEELRDLSPPPPSRNLVTARCR